MGLQSHIENLRSKPEHVRRKAAFWYSFGITSVIFVVWLMQFSSFGLPKSKFVADSVSSVGTPAQSLVAAAGSLVTDIRDIIFAPKKIKYSTVQVSPGKR